MKNVLRWAHLTAMVVGAVPAWVGLRVYDYFFYEPTTFGAHGVQSQFMFWAMVIGYLMIAALLLWFIL